MRLWLNTTVHVLHRLSNRGYSMIMYLARCRDQNEVHEVQKRLQACPTLIYSRVLQKPQDLDFYNAELLVHNENNFSAGHMALRAGEKRRRVFFRSIYPWVILSSALATIFFVLVALLIARMIAGPSSPGVLTITIVWTCIFFILGALSAGGALSLFKGAAMGESAIYAKAEKWLRRGYSVVIAASEGVPDERFQLPNNVIYFDRQSKREFERSA